MDQQLIELIQRVTHIEETNLVNIYPYGSWVYGTATLIGSDHDYIVVARGVQDGQQFDTSSGATSCHVYSEEHWQDMLNEQKIFALECQFLESPILQRRQFRYEVDLPKLRAEISSKASNSFVKAKKKLTVETTEKEHYIGVKSLFHSLRIPMFGTQVARDGKISNYSVANHFWQEIKEDFRNGVRDWEHYRAIFKPVQNELLTDFRKYAEKA